MANETAILGIPEVDRPLAEALPPGFVAVLGGTSSTGAPILAKQFARAGVGSMPVRFYTTYERTDDLKQAYRELGGDPEEISIVNLAEEYYERVLVRGLDVARIREKGLSLEDLAIDPRPSRAPAPYRLTDRLLADLAKIDTPFRLVIDSLDFIAEVLGAGDVMKVAREVRHCCRTVGGQALLALHASRHDAATAGRLADLADLVLELRAEPKGERFVHALWIEKVGHRPDLARILTARLEDGGWRVGGATGASK